MKQLLQQYAAYNVWANQRIFDAINNLSDAAISRDIVSSFPSVYKTVQHMWLAEEAWWKRLKLLENFELESEKFTGSFSELQKKMMAQSNELLNWVEHANEAQLQHEFSYQNSKKERYKQPVYEMLMHVFNHGTYHRGQLVTMLRQLGVEKILPTDMIVFYRKK